jgi:hypothetical protein
VVSAAGQRRSRRRPSAGDAGLDATKRFLASLRDERAAAALSYITACEEAGDLDEFSPEAHLQGYRRYFGA